MFRNVIGLLGLVIFLLGCAGSGLKYDQTTGRVTLIRTAQLGHSDSINSVAFSPNGRFALSGSGDGTVKLWEVRTGREIRTFIVHSTYVNAIAFAPDGNYALVGGSDNLTLWEISTGHKIRSFESKFFKQTHSVAFSPDGRYALSGSHGKIWLWEVNTGREIRTFAGHSSWVQAIAFSPDGRYAISGSVDKTVKLWEINTGRQIKAFTGHGSMVNAVAFSPDGRSILFSGTSNRTIILLDISTGREIRTFTASNSVNSVTFSPDGKYALSGSFKELQLWQISTGREIRSFRGHDSMVMSVAFSLDGNYALSGGFDKKLKLWEINSGREIRSLKGGVSWSVKSVAFSPDGRYVITGNSGKTLKLWEISTGREIQSFKGHSGQMGEINSVAFAPDGKFALSGSNDNTMKLWEISTGREIRSFTGHSDYVNSVAFLPDGRQALSGSADKTLKLWDINTGREIRSFQGHSESIQSMAFSPDGKYALTGSVKELKLWAISTGREIRTLKFLLGHSGTGFYISGANAVAFSPDGKYVLSGITQLKLSEVSTGREIRTFKKDFLQAYINSVAFSPNGRYALSGNSKGALTLLEISTGNEIGSFNGHHQPVLSVAFSPNGKYVVSSSKDTTTRLWDVGTRKEIVQFISTVDGESIAIASDSYYLRSPEGRNAISFVLTPGFDIYAPEQFESYFHRPNIIKARLAGDQNAGKPAPKMTPPPKIEMPDHFTSKNMVSDTYKLKLTAIAQKEVKTVRIFVNGKPVLEENVNVKQKQLNLNVPLFAGANRITAVAYDEKGFSSSPRYVDIISKQPGKPKPNLHIFAIGISEYPKLADNWQLDFAHTDAKALIKTLHKQEGKLFGTVKSNILTNTQATPAKIGEMLDALSAISDNDIAVIFMAGHGTKAKDGTFYFLTQNGDFENPAAGGITWKLFGEKLAKIKGRTLLFLDACHSGSISTETIAPNNELAAKFFKGQTGGVMVFSASKGRQNSLESPDLGGGFGFFTYALTQGLGKKSKQVDTNKNGFVEFMELVDYVKEYVNKETEGMQTPWLSRKELFGDLPIAKVN